MKRRQFLSLSAFAALLEAQPKIDDPILRAMSAELVRSLRLSIAGEVPYFIEYTMEEGANFNCSATLGGLLSSVQSPYRVPKAIVRVGSYEFDNGNAVFTGQIRMARYDNASWPMELSQQQMQQDLWLATDRAYKAAVQEISLKKSALQNITLSEKLNDFAKQPPLVRLLPGAKSTVDTKKWIDIVRRLSAVFNAFPKVLDSRVEMEDSASTFYCANSEGTRVRSPESIATVRVRCDAMAADGTLLRGHRFFHAFSSQQLPSEATLRAEIDALAKSVSTLVDAPQGEAYTGPVLFEAGAAAQLIAQLIGGQLQPVRDPVSVPGRPVNLPVSELEGRLASRVLPEFIDIVDNPKATWQGRPLFGNYEVDGEGVAPESLTVIEKGTLKTLFYTRQPVRGHEGSNGRARLPGNFGAFSALPSNLLVQCRDTVSPVDLKKKFLDLVQQRRKPYGILVRRLDFPSSASSVELRRIGNAMQGSGSSKPFSLPLEIFKVYPDGREEAVRGLRFRGMNAKILRDIVAAGNDAAPFEYLASLAPLSLMGAGGYVAGTGVVCPSLLLDEADLDRPQEERPRLPVVPPPPAETGG